MVGANAAEWAENEDTKKIFTRGAESAQVVVGVKKNRTIIYLTPPSHSATLSSCLLF